MQPYAIGQALKTYDPGLQARREGGLLSLDEEQQRRSESSVQSGLESYATNDLSANPDQLSELEFMATRKVTALRTLIQDIRQQMTGRQGLESTVLKHLAVQVLKVRNELLRVDALAQQNLPQPQGMKQMLTQEMFVLEVKKNDARELSSKDISFLRKEMRDRALELVDAENLLMLARSGAV